MRYRAALVAATVAALVGVFSAGAATQSATYYVSTTGSDSAACTSVATACATFNGAFTKAASGDMVLVETGQYPTQQINPDASKTSTACNGYVVPAVETGCVTFKPDSGATVTWVAEAGVNIGANDVELQGFDFGTDNKGGGVSVNWGGSTGVDPQYVILKNDRGSMLNIDGPASYVADLHGYWSAGDSTAGGNADALRMYPSNPSNTIGPDHVRASYGFYGNVIQAQSGQHLACIHATDASYLIVDHSKATNCAQHDLEIEGTDTGDLIENNILAATCSEQGTICGQVNPMDVGLGQACGAGGATNFTIRFNSVDGMIDFNCGDGTLPANGNVYGNVQTIGPSSYHCGVYQGWGVNFYDNVYGSVSNTGGATYDCGTGSVIADGQFVHPAAPTYDFHLNSGVAAGDLVPTSVAGGYPADDYAGSARPDASETTLDAGSYEMGSAPPPPPPGEPDGDEYAPACAPNCDATIASLQAQVSSLQSEIATANADAKKVVTDLGG